VIVGSGWLKAVLDAARMPGVGLVTPVFRGSGAPAVSRPGPGCALTETFSLSFAALLISGELHRQLGGFDEGLDGGEWCLRDYIRRAEASGCHTCVTAHTELLCGRETVFGSQERRQEQSRLSHDCYLARWGVTRHYCLYFGPEAAAADLAGTVETLAAAARQGHRFTLLLHRRQFKEFRKRGWNILHTGIAICPLPLFGTSRSLARQFDALQAVDPDLIPVRGADNVEFPGASAPRCLNEIVATHENGTSSPAQWGNALEVI
jgi:hypothetical protein